MHMPFRDADAEIEKAAARTVSEIFAELGEAEFRSGERKVIARLLRGRPHVLATGGGAFIDPQTRSLLQREAITVWLKVSLDTLVHRVSRRDTRPLLTGKDPREVLQQLMDVRHPIYAQADVVVETTAESHSAAVAAVLAAVESRVEA